MSNIEDLKKLFGTPKVYNIEGVDMKIPVFSSEDLPLLVQIEEGNQKERIEAVKEITGKVLNLNFSDATSDDLKKISIKTIQGIMEAVKEVNGSDQKPPE